MPNDTPGRGSDQFALRFPDGMREQIKRAAKENGRSMNAEIVARLDQSLFPTLEAIQSIEEKEIFRSAEDLHHRLESGAIQKEEIRESAPEIIATLLALEHVEGTLSVQSMIIENEKGTVSGLRTALLREMNQIMPASFDPYPSARK